MASTRNEPDFSDICLTRAFLQSVPIVCHISEVEDTTHKAKFEGVAGMKCHTKLCPRTVEVQGES